MPFESVTINTWSVVTFSLCRSDLTPFVELEFDFLVTPLLLDASNVRTGSQTGTDGAAVEGEEESDGFAPSSVPPVISIDDDESPASAADSPGLASSGAAANSAEKSGDGAAGSFGGKATKPLFTTSTKHDEKMNEFAREFHQSVLQTTRQQLGDYVTLTGTLDTGKGGKGV